jgi:hypothetical protein
MRAAARRRTVRLAFELYSIGEYSLERLAKALTDRGYKHEAKMSSGWTDLDGIAGRNTSGCYCLGIVTPARPWSPILTCRRTRFVSGCEP